MAQQPDEMASLVTCLVLAGGCGRRMEGKDKGLVHYQGRPLISHIHRRIGDRVSNMLVSVNRNHNTYRNMGYSVVSDFRPGFAGPMAGVESGLLSMNTPLLMVIPCDTPLFPDDLLDRLMMAVHWNGDRAAYVVSDGQHLPVFCLLQSNLVNSARHYLDCGRRSMHGWLEKIGSTPVEWHQPTIPFLGANSADELQVLENLSGMTH